MRQIAFIAPMLLLCACATNTGTGVLVGGGSGALIGGVAGGWQGALIGGAVGAVVGGLIGNYLDEQDQKRMSSHPGTLQRIDQGQPLTTQDVINLHNNGVSDHTTLRYLRDQHICYTLSDAQKQSLRDAGISHDLYEYMTTTEC